MWLRTEHRHGNQVANPEARGIRLSFPSMPADTPAWEFPGFISDLNALYEVLVLATAVGYEDAVLPTAVRIRRSSLLVPEDRLLVRRIKYGSPWQADLVVAGVDALQGLPWLVTSLAALKFLPDFLERGVDMVEKVATWRHRARMRELEEIGATARARQLELENEQLQLDLHERRRVSSGGGPQYVRRSQDDAGHGIEDPSHRATALAVRAGGASDAEVARLLRGARERVLSIAQGAAEVEDLPTDDDPDNPAGDQQ